MKSRMKAIWPILVALFVFGMWVIYMRGVQGVRIVRGRWLPPADQEVTGPTTVVVRAQIRQAAARGGLWFSAIDIDVEEVLKEPPSVMDRIAKWYGAITSVPNDETAGALCRSTHSDPGSMPREGQQGFRVFVPDEAYAGACRFPEGRFILVLTPVRVSTVVFGYPDLPGETRFVWKLLGACEAQSTEAQEVRDLLRAVAGKALTSRTTDPGGGSKDEPEEK